MAVRDLPGRVVRKLNRLGFALVDGDQPYTFIRLGTSGDLRVLIQASGPDSWRVGMAVRAMNQPGHLPEPVLPVSLRGFGPSSDGLTLDVSTSELTDLVPRVIRDNVLSVWDVAPT
jgi:hypothetical protein